MKKVRIAALALALVMLAGCGKTSGSKDNTPQEDDLTYQASGIKSSYALMTVDGETVSAEEYFFWLTNSIVMEQYYGLLSSDADWAGSAEDLKNEAKEACVLYAEVRRRAKEYNVELDAATEAQMAQELADAIEQGGGDESFNDYLYSMCISRKGFEELNRLSYLRQSLMAKMEANGELTVTEADKADLVEKIIKDNNLYAAKHILLQTRRMNAEGTGYEDVSDEEKAELYARMEGFLAEIRDSADPAAKFDELMNAHSEDGRNEEDGSLNAPNGYNLVGAGEMVPEFEEAALALEVGGISDIVTTAYGYHVVMRIPLDMDSLKLYVDENADAEFRFSQLNQEWVDGAKVETTQAYEDIDPKAFYEKLEELVNARAILKALENPSAAPEG